MKLMHVFGDRHRVADLLANLSMAPSGRLFMEWNLTLRELGGVLHREKWETL